LPTEARDSPGERRWAVNSNFRSGRTPAREHGDLCGPAWQVICSSRRHVEAVRLCAEERRGSTSLLHRHHCRRGEAARRPQRRLQRSHRQVPSVIRRRRHRVRRRASAFAFERYLKSGSDVAFARGICDSGSHLISVRVV